MEASENVLFFFILKYTVSSKLMEYVRMKFMKYGWRFFYIITFYSVSSKLMKCLYEVYEVWLKLSFILLHLILWVRSLLPLGQFVSILYIILFLEASIQSKIVKLLIKSFFTLINYKTIEIPNKTIEIRKKWYNEQKTISMKKDLVNNLKFFWLNISFINFHLNANFLSS